ncbi:MAG: sporulation protein, partial [Flavobacteriales bacterium]|nr:sporulation protein [Flavobacteriales bacterium]
MGFFQKLKSKMGIGGVKIEIDTPGQISKEDGRVTGKFYLTTKSDQEIKEMKVALLERYTTGRGEDKKTKEFTLGSQKYNDTFAIKTGDRLEYEFDFPFEILKSS